VRAAGLTRELFRGVIADAAVRCDDSVWRFGCAGEIPACVVFPRTTEDVCAVVRAAAAQDLALVAAGNGGNLNVGAPPRRYDAAVSLKHMARIVAHEPGDMTITAEAGVTLAQLNTALAVHGQWLPLDPPRDGELTVGGLIAADRCGPARLSYGKVRDYLIGIRVVTADGELLSGGGRVVKNVAGYDLPKLFTGSFGTLGIIVEATFKVRPRPQVECLAVWPADTIGAATQRGFELLQTTLTPLFVEAVNGHGSESIGVTQDPALLIGGAGSAPEVVAFYSALGALGGDAIRWYEAPQSLAMMKALRAFSQAATDDALVARVSVLPAQLPALLERLEREAVSRGILVEIGAHAGVGVAWCQVHAAHDPDLLMLYAEWMRVQTRHAGGWAVFEHIPTLFRERLDPWGFAEPSLPLMVAIKRALDPRAMFSPGRFVGGI
jgi:glycolate oxidase FAD binding subunit